MAQPQRYDGASFLETVALPPDMDSWVVPEGYVARVRTAWVRVSTNAGLVAEASIVLLPGPDYATITVEAAQPATTGYALRATWSTEVGTAASQRIGVLNDFTSVNPLPAVWLYRGGTVSVLWSLNLISDPFAQIELVPADTLPGPGASGRSDLYLLPALG
jgi:hypothetical protein